MFSTIVDCSALADGTRDGKIFLEGGIDESVLDELKKKGHNIQTNVVGHDRAIFGRAQIVQRSRENGVYWAGTIVTVARMAVQ